MERAENAVLLNPKNWQLAKEIQKGIWGGGNQPGTMLRVWSGAPATVSNPHEKEKGRPG